jgi:hypothetical protein
MLTYEQMATLYGSEYRDVLGSDIATLNAVLRAKADDAFDTKLDPDSLGDQDKLKLRELRTIRKISRIADDAKAYGAIGFGATELAGVIVGTTIDIVKSELKKESERYHAEFGRRKPFDNFWLYATDNNNAVYRVQNYAGFELIRTTASTSNSSPAFKLVCAITPSSDKEVFRVCPIYFQAQKAKAKVLTKKLYAPWTYFAHSGDAINVEVQFRFDAIWVDKDQKIHTESMGSDTIPFNQYNIGECSPIPASELKENDKGWFSGVAISTDRNTGRPIGRGTFWLDLVVKEADSSKAEKYLQQGASYVEKHRNDWVEQAKKLTQ